MDNQQFVAELIKRERANINSITYTEKADRTFNLFLVVTPVYIDMESRYKFRQSMRDICPERAETPVVYRKLGDHLLWEDDEDGCPPVAIELGMTVCKLCGAIDNELEEPCLANPDARIAAQEAAETVTHSKALRDVIAERKRQRAVEGWTSEHDDKHTDRSLGYAAACYAEFGAMTGVEHAYCTRSEMIRENKVWKVFPRLWPDTWDKSWWKPTTPRRNLVKAAALILAEIERLDRKDDI